ncbi:MAG: GtrA family protein [Legionellales bacterium]|nr:GtrA family protein [Legionellales bacterium]
MIFKQFGMFLLVGIPTVLIDLIVYYGLISLGLNIGISKAIGFITSLVLTYFANKLWTFGHIRYFPPYAPIKFTLLYLFTLVINVVSNKLALQGLATVQYKLFYAFLIATACASILNFLGLKFFVFYKDIKKRQRRQANKM